MKAIYRLFPLIVILAALLIISAEPATASKKILPSMQTEASSPIRPQNASPDQFWSDEFYEPGPSAGVLAVATVGTDVYIGGVFYSAGPVVGKRIARWDGNAWHSLGNANGYVQALAVDSQGNLYAGGEFTEIGGVSASFIARWDGSAWHSFGSGANGYIQAIIVDAQGNLYAGGNFTAIGGVSAYHIARWDGSAWHPLGGGTSGNVKALAVDSLGNLYAGGYFNEASGVMVHGIARWDGSAWHPLGDGAGRDEHIEALAVDSQGALYASFAGYSVARIARWDGSAWYSLTGFMGGCDPLNPNVHINALAVDTLGNLYAGGWFCGINGLSTKHIARWDGNAWYSLDGGVNGGGVSTLLVDAQGNLHVGGWFSTAGDVGASRIARWDGDAWYPYAGSTGKKGMGMSAFVQTLLGDGQGQVYAGGWFTTAGDVIVNNIARWDGSAWHALGGGASSGNILALAEDDQGNLYAGGTFDEIGGIGAHNIARWDGNTWHSLDGGADDVVWALAMDSEGNLYAAGDFLEIGGVIAYHIARWDGSAWYPLGGGSGSYIRALAVDSQDNLYAIGYITGFFAGVGRWDGQWHSLGDTNGAEYALAVDSQGNLYVGGYFTQISGISANHIARWDGNTWHPLGSGTNGDIYALATDSHGNLYAGGVFGEIGGVIAENIACWDGNAWHPLGSGAPQGNIKTLALSHEGNLYAGGSIFFAGGKPSSNIARWTPPATLQGHIWLDQNANGIQDAGEPGAPDISVHLYDSNNVLTATAITQLNSFYEISYLWPGTYTFEFTPPYGYALTLQNQGGDDTLDSDPDPLSGRTEPISLTIGQVASNWDAGLVPLPFPLTVSVTGAVTGTVTSTPPGIACPPACSHDFPFASPVSLAAIPAPGAVFTQWSGDAVGFSPTTTITIAGPQLITAAFQPPITETRFVVSPTLLSANGLDTAALTFSATTATGSEPLAGRPILFSLANQLGELSEAVVSFDASGVATATFTAGLTPGNETLSATFYEDGLPTTLTATLALAPNPLSGQLTAEQNRDVITYTFTITNAAAFSQTIALSGSLPLHSSFVAVSGADFSPTGGDFGAGYVHTNGIALAPGESTVISWSVRAVRGGDVFTLAHAASHQARLQIPVHVAVYKLFLPLLRLK